MYQTVMILLVTALVTIITTVITVRLTMVGHIVSQTAKERLKARAKRYGVLSWCCLASAISIFFLINNTFLDAPVTRKSIFTISFWMLFSGLYLTAAAGLLGYLISTRHD
jgi:predicted transporter